MRHTKHADGIWLSTRRYPTEDEPEGAAVFRVASRLNHSCAPNAHAAYNVRTKRMTVHALVPIHAGQEVLVSYLGDPDMRSIRQSELLRDFGFRCRCHMCSLRGAALATSEVRQARIKHLSAQIYACPCPPNVVALCEEKLALLEQEGQLTNWGTMANAMQFLELTGQIDAARGWARRAAMSSRRALGKDSKEYREYSAALKKWSSG